MRAIIQDTLEFVSSTTYNVLYGAIKAKEDLLALKESASRLLDAVRYRLGESKTCPCCRSEEGHKLQCSLREDGQLVLSAHRLVDGFDLVWPKGEPDTNVALLSVLVVDTDNIGVDQIVDQIENTRYANDCIAPSVLSAQLKRTKWEDDNPLNKRGKVAAAVKELFKTNGLDRV